MEDHGGEQEGYSFCSAVYGAGETACLASEVEGEVETEEVFEDVAGYAADCFLGDGGEDCVSEFLGEGCAYSCGAV